MAIPSRQSNDQATPLYRRMFFVTTKTSMGRRLLQSGRFAELFVDVLRKSMAAGRFQIHDFVVMPDHVHLLLSVADGMSIEEAVQFIKGGFSYRVKKELGYDGEVWQRGFSEVQVVGGDSFEQHRRYIALNPERAGLVGPGEEYGWSFETLRRRKAQGLKPH
jgi:putative transposase